MSQTPHAQVPYLPALFLFSYSSYNAHNERPPPRISRKIPQPQGRPLPPTRYIKLSTPTAQIPPPPYTTALHHGLTPLPYTTARPIVSPDVLFPLHHLPMGGSATLRCPSITRAASASALPILHLCRSQSVNTYVSPLTTLFYMCWMGIYPAGLSDPRCCLCRP